MKTAMNKINIFKTIKVLADVAKNFLKKISSKTALITKSV